MNIKSNDMTDDLGRIKSEIIEFTGDSKWNFIKTKASTSKFIGFWKSIKLENELEVLSVESSEINIDQVIVWLKSKFNKNGLPIYSQEIFKLQTTQQEELSNISRLIFFRQNNKESTHIV